MAGAQTASRDIVASLREMRADIESRYPVRLVGVFGSAGRDELRADSDIDVLADYRPGLSLVKLGALHRALTARLGRNVDIVLKDALKPSIRERIEKDLVRL